MTSKKTEMENDLEFRRDLAEFTSVEDKTNFVLWRVYRMEKDAIVGCAAQKRECENERQAIRDEQDRLLYRIWQGIPWRIKAPIVLWLIGTLTGIGAGIRYLV